MKHFDVYPDREYNNNLGAEFPNLIYFDNRFIEIEPNSAMVKLKPTESNSYNENWWLFKYPKDTDNTFDAIEAVQIAQKNSISK